MFLLKWHVALQTLPSASLELSHKVSTIASDYDHCIWLLEFVFQQMLQRVYELEV